MTLKGGVGILYKRVIDISMLKLVEAAGIEPATFRMQTGRSTAELRPRETCNYSGLFYEKWTKLRAKVIFNIVMRVILLILGLFLATFARSEESLRLATTTSVENSGLLGHLLPEFERECKCKVRAVVAGSGHALALARRGDTDVVLTHAPAAEEQFFQDGYADIRREVMTNNFIIAGPSEDKAGVSEEQDIVGAMKKIVSAGASFVSRGDDSGTHQKERTLWEFAGVKPLDEYYIEAGAGMGRALLIADELGAYILSDYGTYLAFRDKVELRSFPPGGERARNVYTVMAVSSEKHGHVKHELSRKFIEWLTSSQTQKRIGEYRYHGEALFTPAEP